ncbi:tRNA-splicing ligase RtcB [Candidatus Bilamarchaeum dharawalense]|uniref:tRNA-splicing ligase RtcB n=1 Tax=Candidatus Bilamarchaeum dharawalense TaxID=2885759 RepID=A0A5E4LPD1_9ARCH|nr:tRNA-splicing ligase RtcB [Candidatus Bilamarchaeum dharawalense]
MRTNKEQLAEILGIFLGDGSIYINKQHGVIQIVITGHLQNDFNYLVHYVKPLLEKNLSAKFRIKQHRFNAIQIYNQSKYVAIKLNRLGFPSGNKVKNNVEIPSWVFGSRKYIRACIRGLIDTDGSVCPITGRNYPYIWFKCRIPKLRKSFSKAMNLLNYRISNWSIRKDHVGQTYIGQKSLIYRYYKEIGFNNTYHKDRFTSLRSSRPVKH